MDKLVAVYGTLRINQPRNFVFRNSEYLGEGYTKDKYLMYYNSYPKVYDVIGGGDETDFIDKETNIIVDVYKVSESTLATLDAIESHPHFYQRKQIKVKVKGEELIAWLYFINDMDFMEEDSKIITSGDYNKFHKELTSK